MLVLPEWKQASSVACAWVFVVRWCNSRSRYITGEGSRRVPLPRAVEVEEVMVFFIATSSSI